MIPMMNNPIGFIIQAAQAGRNPMAALQMLSNANPQMAQVFNMINGKNEQQLKTMAENMCRERGTTPQQVISQFGLRF